MGHNIKARTIIVNPEDWKVFLQKHKSASERLRELVKADIENRVDIWDKEDVKS